MIATLVNVEDMRASTLHAGIEYTESTFPRSREVLAEVLDGVPDDEVQRITAGNAAQLYSFDVPLTGPATEQ
jgi:hypothetical protein